MKLLYLKFTNGILIIQVLRYPNFLFFFIMFSLTKLKIGTFNEFLKSYFFSFLSILNCLMSNFLCFFSDEVAFFSLFLNTSMFSTSSISSFVSKIYLIISKLTFFSSFTILSFLFIILAFLDLLAIVSVSSWTMVYSYSTSSESYEYSSYYFIYSCKA